MAQRNPAAGIHRQNVGCRNESDFIDYCLGAGVTTVTILDAAVLAGRMVTAGVPYSIYREYKFEPDPKERTGADFEEYCQDQ